LRAGGIGYFCGGNLRCGGECGGGFPGVGIVGRSVHLSLAQLANDFFDLEIIGAGGLGLNDLPFLLVAAELDVLFPGDELDLAELVEIESEQALVAEIVRRFVEAGLVVAGDGENATVAFELGKNGAARRSLVAEENLLRLGIFGGDVELKRRLRKAVLAQVCGFVVHEAIGIQRR